MTELVSAPVPVPAPGGKLIEEFFGQASTGDATVSVARMVAPPGWSEPGQRPSFEELTVVLEGSLVVEHCEGRFVVGAGQACRTRPEQWVRYSSPGGAHYVAICLPAFSPAAARRDEGPAEAQGPDASAGAGTPPRAETLPGAGERSGPDERANSTP